MSTDSEYKDGARTRTDAFTNVAFWQLMAFVFLMCFIWLNEYMDLPAIVFGTCAVGFDPYRAAMLSAGVITAGIITVGHTYERQRKMVQQLVQTCLYCHRVMNEDGRWEHVEEYFVRNFPVSLNTSACPDCQQMLEAVDASKKKIAKIQDEKLQPGAN